MKKITIQNYYHTVYLNNITGEYVKKEYRYGETEDLNLSLVHSYSAFEIELDTPEYEFNNKINELYEEFKKSEYYAGERNVNIEKGEFTIHHILPDHSILDKIVYIKDKGE